MVHNSYTMSTRGLPDAYTYPETLGLQPSCTYQANYSCPWHNDNMYNIYVWLLKYLCDLI